jgi:hypothetical protein
MKCKLDLIILTKIKRMIRYCKLCAFGGKVALNTISIELTQVSVPTETDHDSH